MQLLQGIQVLNHGQRDQKHIGNQFPHCMLHQFNRTCIIESIGVCVVMWISLVQEKYTCNDPSGSVCQTMVIETKNRQKSSFHIACCTSMAKVASQNLLVCVWSCGSMWFTKTTHALTLVDPCGLGKERTCNDSGRGLRKEHIFNDSSGGL